MADLAIGRQCPQCGTLTACSGSFADAELVGKCACCGATVYASAHGGERAHAIRAAGAPLASQGGVADLEPVVPSVSPDPPKESESIPKDVKGAADGLPA